MTKLACTLPSIHTASSPPSLADSLPDSLHVTQHRMPTEALTTGASLPLLLLNLSDTISEGFIQSATGSPWLILSIRVD